METLEEFLKFGRCYGKKITGCQIAEKTKISGQGIQPMPRVRPAACVSEKVRHVPNLFQGTGVVGGNSWSHQIQLVDDLLVF